MRDPFARQVGLFLVLIMLASPISGHAENLMKVPPEMRLLRGTPDQGEASLNAVVTQMAPDQLPDNVQEEVKVKLIEYTGNIKQLANLVVYSWDAPWFHAQNHPPNYLISFASIQPEEKLAVSLTSLPCNDEGCLLVGYASGGDGVWRQDFDMRAVKIDFVQVPASNKKDYQLEIHTLSHKDNCEKDGAQTKRGCMRKFSWRKLGLTVLPKE